MSFEPLEDRVAVLEKTQASLIRIVSEMASWERQHNELSILLLEMDVKWHDARNQITVSLAKCLAQISSSLNGPGQMAILEFQKNTASILNKSTAEFSKISVEIERLSPPVFPKDLLPPLPGIQPGDS